MKKQRLALLAAVTVTAGPSLADQEIAHLDQVVVTATRSETALENLPVPVVVIDRATIERNAGATLPDLLRLAAGVEIARNGGPGQLSSAFLRGTESDHVLVLIDGVELNPGTLSTPQLQNIDPNVIERIEIVKGPRSALYGSEAVGGVINIITRRDAAGLRAHVGAGSFGSSELGAGARISSDSTSFDFDIGRRESDGFPPLASSDIDSGFDNTTANLRLRSELGPLGVSLRHFYSEGTTEYLDFMLQPTSQDFENRMSEVRLDWQSGTWRSTISISQARDLLEQNDSDSFADTDRRVLDWQNDFTAGTHLLTAGLYIENEAVLAENFGGTDADTDVRAIYLQDQWAGEKLDLLLALRGTDHDRFGNELSWNIDSGWRFNRQWSVRGNIGRAFRAPNASFLYGPFGANPDLQPEVSQNVELGVDWKPLAKQKFTLAIFDNRIDDMIDFEFTTSMYQNIAEVRIRGLEVGHQWQAADWRGHASASLQKPENRQTGETLLRRAERKLVAGIARQLGQVDLGLDLLASGERPDIDAETFLPVTGTGYVLLNLTANWHLAPRWSLAGRIENLLDTDYQTAAGYNSAERSVFVTLRYSR